MKVTVHDAIDDIDAPTWNALAGDRYPFLKHEFLSIAENTGCASPDTGWTPRHLTLTDDAGLVAALPLYEKAHSWGEFVFDWAWAEAYQRYGLDYYPKLTSAIPFTPATSSKLLLRDPGDDESAGALLGAARTACAELECSSLHVLFPQTNELTRLESSGFKIRNDCQFHWHNDGYGDFEDFLSSFSRVKRKKVRQDRRRVADAGITFRHAAGSELSADEWRHVHTLMSVTFLRRGCAPYFDLAFFQQLSDTLPESLRVVLAEKHSSIIAAAVFYKGSDTLYGRYWGADGYYDALHFETCYYQGIEFCIENQLSVFEPGTQGEHKVARGFVPTRCFSAHWLDNPDFFSAIERYLDQETDYTERYMQAVDAHSPYRRGSGS